MKEEGGRGGLFLFFYQHLYIKGGGVVRGVGDGDGGGGAHTHVYMYIYIYIYIYIYEHMYIYIYMPVHLYLHILATHLRIATQILNTQQQRPQ